MRKHDIFPGLRIVYALLTLAKLISGRGQIAPDPKLRKLRLRGVYACLRNVYAMFAQCLRMNTHERKHA